MPWSPSFRVILDGGPLADGWDGFWCDPDTDQYYLIADGKRIYLVEDQVRTSERNPNWNAETRTLTLTSDKSRS